MHCKTLLIARRLKELMTCRLDKIDPGNCAGDVHEYGDLNRDELETRNLELETRNKKPENRH